MRKLRGLLMVIAVGITAAACGGDSPAFVDAAIDAAATDAADIDAATDAVTDAADIDAADVDAGAIDAADVDAGAIDATDVDAGTIIDAATVDAGPPGDATVLSDGAVAFPDPAPGVDTPGEHGGTGCPDSNQTTFTLGIGAATTHTFSGQVSAAVGDGVFWVRGPGGETVAGTVETDGAGNYAKTLPIFCGANLVKLVWNNGTCPLVLVYQVDRTTCVSADITATVQWDDLGLDWELHLIKPGGTINDNATDCTWTSCIGSSPDWGVVGDTADDPHKDIDNTGNFGPENIWLAGPETGRYTVMVEHWGGGTPSSGFVTLNVGGQVVTVSLTGLASHAVWTAATIDWPSGVVTTGQTVTDCSANWSNGCRLAIPVP